MRNFEEHLACNGTVVLKSWLNISKQEQCNRFLRRIHEPRKDWKFSETGAEKKGCQDIATKCDISEKLVLNWVNRADLLE